MVEGPHGIETQVLCGLDAACIFCPSCGLRLQLYTEVQRASSYVHRAISPFEASLAPAAEDRRSSMALHDFAPPEVVFVQFPLTDVQLAALTLGWPSSDGNERGGP